MIGPLGRLGAAATLGQHCPQMTQRRCTYKRSELPKGGRPGPGWTQKTEELKNVIVGLASHPPDGRARGGTAEWEVAAASSHRPTPSASSDRISSIGCLTPSISPYWSQLARGKIHVRLSVSATFPSALK